MDNSTAIILASGIGLTGSILGALISKYDLMAGLRRSPFSVAGEWSGISAYLAGGISDPKTEAVYQVSMSFKQTGYRVRLEERIHVVADALGNPLKGFLPRTVKGQGRILGDGDLVLSFKEEGTATCGGMYLHINDQRTEIRGILAVRNPHAGKPVALKLVARRANDSKLPTFEDLAF